MSRKRDTRTPWEQEMDERRKQAERQDARMNETMSRRDILEAIDAALYHLESNPLDTVPRQTLKALREAFE